MRNLNSSSYHYIISRGKKIEMPDRWLQPDANKRYWRLVYIKSMQAHTPTVCPECQTETLIYEEDGEVYCSKCGLVVMDTYSYTAGIRLEYPYGLRIG